MFEIAYTVNGKDVMLTDLTEAQASKALRAIVSEFYNRELGCTNGLARHHGDIYVSRNFKTALYYTSGDFYRVKKGETKMVCDWEEIFTKYITKIS